MPDNNVLKGPKSPPWFCKCGGDCPTGNWASRLACKVCGRDAPVHIAKRARENAALAEQRPKPAASGKPPSRGSQKTFKQALVSAPPWKMVEAERLAKEVKELRAKLAEKNAAPDGDDTAEGQTDSAAEFFKKRSKIAANLKFLEETFGAEHSSATSVRAELATLDSSRPPMSQKIAERKKQNLDKKLEKFQAEDAEIDKQVAELHKRKAEIDIQKAEISKELAELPKVKEADCSDDALLAALGLSASGNEEGGVNKADYESKIEAIKEIARQLRPQQPGNNMDVEKPLADAGGGALTTVAPAAAAPKEICAAELDELLVEYNDARVAMFVSGVSSDDTGDENQQKTGARDKFQAVCDRVHGAVRRGIASSRFAPYV